ncbi:MAG: hypothetical protein ACQKBY_02125, partial [Verrucomicrobiales bacterium]
MKLKYAYPALLAASSLFLGSCKNKEAADTPGGSEDSVVENIKEALTPGKSAEERAASLGFVKHLPENTEMVFSFLDGAGLLKELRGSALGKLVEQNLVAQGTNIEEELANDPQAAMVLQALSEEIFVSLGADGGQQMANGLKFANAMNYGQMKMMVTMLAQQLQGNGDPAMMQAGSAQLMLSGLLNDPAAGIELIESIELPQITVGLKVSDTETRDQLAGMLSGGLQQMLSDSEFPGEAFSVEKNGFSLSGVKIDGQKLASKIDDNGRAQLAQMFGGEAEAERLIKALSEKNVFLTSSVKDEYLFLSLAGSEDALAYAADPDSSLAANSDLQFVDAHLGKKIHLFSYGQQGAIAKLLAENEGSITSYVNGILDGLKENAVFGDTTDIQTLLKHVAKLSGDYYDLYQAESLGSIGFQEEGFKIETIGGHNHPDINFAHQHSLAPLGAQDGVFFFADWTNDEKAAELALELVDSLGESAYAIAKQASQLDIEDGDFEQFAQGFGMFEKVFAKDLTQVWTALRSDLAQGVGSENAIVIDLNGGLPKVPGVPAPLLEKGKMPRITFAAPVEDRAKLAASWDKLNTALTGILKNVSEMSGTEIPMQEPLSSSSDGATSYFFTTIPFTTNDFMPNVTVSDDYFFVSTSKALTTQLGQTLAAGGGVERQGAYLEVNFAALQSYLSDWYQLVDENQDTLFEGNEMAKGDFAENKKMISDALQALEEL